MSLISPKAHKHAYPPSSEMEEALRLSSRRRRAFTPYAFMLPAITALVLVGVVPFVYAVYISVRALNLIDPTSDRFVGVQNYINLAQDGRAWHAVLITVLYSGISVCGELALGLAVSLLLNRSFAGRAIVRTLLLIPIVMTPVVAGLMWRIFYDPNAGIINYVLGQLGLGSRHDWLGNVHNALGSLIVTDIWQWTPFIILILMAGLESLPGEPFEAARMDGASHWQMFRFVTLPLLRATIVVAVLLRTLDSLKTFDTIYVMTQGGPALATETANMYAYTQGFTYFNVSYATAFALAFTIVLSVVITFLVQRFVFTRQERAEA